MDLSRSGISMIYERFRWPGHLKNVYFLLLANNRYWLPRIFWMNIRVQIDLFSFLIGRPNPGGLVRKRSAAFPEIKYFNKYNNTSSNKYIEMRTMLSTSLESVRLGTGEEAGYRYALPLKLQLTFGRISMVSWKSSLISGQDRFSAFAPPSWKPSSRNPWTGRLVTSEAENFRATGSLPPSTAAIRLVVSRRGLDDLTSRHLSKKSILFLTALTFHSRYKIGSSTFDRNIIIIATIKCIYIKKRELSF